MEIYIEDEIITYKTLCTDMKKVGGKQQQLICKNTSSSSNGIYQRTGSGRK